ncbi:TPA: HamA C-terminal domain-containing protein [Pseudomonas aeruginosa]|uniref:HamA C-terminal domain-containing protein n=1 Tax=Pseudomonas aeruginosa TaxID=287 RepID=UPI00070A99C6|nr:DUF1837 domain-containing protein [Pseudomonas aeruginosa]EKV3036163.1 DUF1837 domain-containing protein [Pseudomonas aeruginosa]EKV3076764.1 DUF1837 domain-containing protein [Pseudomonas aeruginosa]MBX6028766.1 DUF1837 domain-containing protein [Pseudomonas aeruginosa]MCO2599008.1 DUF1837 domain-containing protein [Pseudomonas aeruginosa]MCO2803326.1 DUF1837 domain-containing protein [Pseudomonas aeruginosa]
MVVKYPDPLLEVRACCIESPPFTSLCVGYEGGVWRSKALADHLFQWIPYVALDQESQLSMGSHNFLELLQRATAHIYNTKKTENRGEIGEILLHIACVSSFNTSPILCKLILKTSSNDTVKGFDGVHVLVKDDKVELWLGESKFYSDPRSAIREAVKSIKEHILPDFLSTEKAMIIGHIGHNIPKKDEITRLFKRQTSSDELLRISVFPILIAYESKSVASFTELTDRYYEELLTESEALRQYFADQSKNMPLRFQIIFVPIESKSDVISKFDKRLESFS